LPGVNRFLRRMRPLDEAYNVNRAVLRRMLQTQQDVLSRIWPLIIVLVVIVGMLKFLTIIPTWLLVVTLIAGAVWVVRAWWLP
jgi:uncharacterized membrane protein